MKPNEVDAVSDLVLRSFSSFVAPSYSDEGRMTFSKFAQPQKIAERDCCGHFTIVAEIEGKVVGMVQVRRPSHVLMLFVDGHAHGRGVARKLVESAVERIESEQRIKEVTVNSTPNAIEAYRRIGFVEAGTEQTTEGITFTPMVMRLRESDPPKGVEGG
jgi:ribosomal protein S18 acetylase RimI-like enzyme